MFEILTPRFAKYLSENHINVPTSLQIDFIKLIPHIDVKDRFMFKETIRQLWIKEFHKFELFDKCFHEFFFNQTKDIMKEMQLSKKQNELNALQSEALYNTEKSLSSFNSHEWISDKLNQKSSKSSEILNNIHNKNLSSLIEEPSWVSQHTPSKFNDLIEEMMWDAISEEQPSIVLDSLQQLSEHVDSFRNEILKIKKISHEILISNEKDKHKGMRKVIYSEIDHLKERKIKQLNKTEISKLSEYINMTSLKFLTKIGRILRTTKKYNEIDIQKTTADSLKTFGVPIRFSYHKGKMSKTKIHLILDVSGSVIKSAEFLSLFAYLIHKQFPQQVRSFVFVGKLDEVTNYYTIDDENLAVEYSLKKAKIDYKGYSNYDEALMMYENNYLQDVDRNTIVLFLGDARNNRNDARISTIKSIKERSKFFFWLNPEEKEKWNSGDSVIGKYQKYCDGLYETTTLNHLEQSLEELTTIISNKKM